MEGLSALFLARKTPRHDTHISQMAEELGVCLGLNCVRGLRESEWGRIALDHVLVW